MGSGIRVAIAGIGEYLAGLRELAEKLQSRFEFVDALEGGSVSARIKIQENRRMYSVDRYEGVMVNTWQMNGVCQYTGLSPEAYLLVGIMLGLTQWRVLKLNPLIQSYDLGHSWPDTCLFSRPSLPQEVALMLENPTVCPGCRDFYRCLGAEEEILTVQRVMDHLAKQ